MKSFTEFVDGYGDIDEDEFVNNYIKDKSVFGEDTKDIYADVYSELLGEDVDFDAFDGCVDAVLDEREENLGGSEHGIGKVLGADEKADALNKLEVDFNLKNPNNISFSQSALGANIPDLIKDRGNKKIFKTAIGLDKANSANKPFGINTNNLLDFGKNKVGFGPAPITGEYASSLGKQINADDAAKAAAAAEAAAASKESFISKMMEGLKGFAASLIGKIRSALSGSKEGSVKYWISKGFEYVIDPKNLSKVLGTTGGVILVGVIINSLRRKHQLNKYKQLQSLYNQQKNEVEECYDGDYNSLVGAVITESIGDSNMMRIVEDTFGVDYDLMCEDLDYSEDADEDCQDNEEEDTEEKIDESSEEQNNYFKY